MYFLPSGSVQFTYPIGAFPGHLPIFFEELAVAAAVLIDSQNLVVGNERQREAIHLPQVAALGSEAVFLKLNAEDHSQGQRFASDHGVRGYPTTVVMDASGRAIQQQAGYISPPSVFIQWVHRARQQ